ncbi:phage virion morphogenesis protein [Ancylobacter lacus]|uniref:phage virion morphogenesis protein n=1 Tax=Ancylobacter lacus TaxID=2579970 RepID=UPI001BCB47DF|nr:phage virion morphogenesis protein [Ancylobacter lacus]MBS7541488.1 phage virion morphogenesis protein [Ancylobacter lacus]
MTEKTPGALLTIDDDAVVSGLARLVAASVDLRAPLANIGQVVRQSTIDRFAREVSPAGVPWAPLNPEYRAGKKGPGILRENRRLSDIVWQLGGNAVQVGSSVVYARVHQFGAVILPKTAAALVFSLGGRIVHAMRVIIPARPFLGLSAEDLIEITAILDDHFIAGTGGAAERV